MKRQIFTIFLVVVVFTGIAYGQSTKMDTVKAEIIKLLLLKKGADIVEITNEKTVHNFDGYPTDISVFDDRIEIQFKTEKTSIIFPDILDDKIKVFWVNGKNSDGHAKAKVFVGHLLIEMRQENAYSLEKDLNFIQNKFNEKRFKELVLFEPVAAGYRELKTKPAVPEEQRKCIVQANMVNEQKNYQYAIELYKKAISIDQTTYPAAYSNLALLTAQTKKYDAAIYYMKKYLLLQPDAADARSGQDKIYEWEIMMKQNN